MLKFESSLSVCPCVRVRVCVCVRVRVRVTYVCVCVCVRVCVWTGTLTHVTRWSGQSQVEAQAPQNPCKGAILEPRVAIQSHRKILPCQNGPWQSSPPSNHKTVSETFPRACVHTCVCTRTSTHTHAHTHAHAHAYAGTRTRIRTHTHTHMYTRTWTQMLTHVHIRSCQTNQVLFAVIDSLKHLLTHGVRSMVMTIQRIGECVIQANGHIGVC